MKQFSIWVLTLVVGMTISACNTTKKVATSTTEEKATMTETAEKSMAEAKGTMSMVGAWDLTISDTPAGDVEASMMVEETNGAYKAYMGTTDGKVEVDDLKVEGNKMSGSFYNSEYGIDVDFNISLDETGKKLSGYLMDQFKVTGKRKTM